MSQENGEASAYDVSAPLIVLSGVTKEEYEKMPVWQQEYLVKRMVLEAKHMFPERLRTQADNDRLEASIRAAIMTADSDKIGKSVAFM